MKRFVLNETDYAGEIGGIALSVDQTEGAPTEFRLGQNYPNPFNASTVITFDLPDPADVRAELFDVHGRRVSLLA